MKKSLLTTLFFALILMATGWQNLSGQTYHLLSGGSFSQDWSNTGLLTVSDTWSAVPSIIGYRGDNGTATTGVDPQTVVADLSLVIDVNVDQTDGGTYTTGGVTEFHLTDPVVGLTGSGTADAPNIVLYINTTNCSNIKVKYDLRDLDGSADNAVQAFALQYRIGNTGDYTNIPAGFVADATTGPSLATLVTPVNVELPAACNNQAQVQIRIITTNANGNDEYVGIDNIVVEVDATPPAANFNPANAATGVAINVTPVITFDEPVRKTDGSELTNGDLSTLVTLKETDASGAAVAFTAVIDAAKKVITVTPSANLKNNQLYYLAVGPVEDAAGNESTLKSVTFTTISASTPTVTVTYPNGGEVMYSGDLATVTWTTTNFDAGENVKIDVWLPDLVWYTIEASTPNDGSQVVTVGPKADYGTIYKIRVSGVTNGASDESDNPFTI
ncbi:MAG: Ig-like domain-containing protein, partial [Bacteroidales bacterium]|nr:Ig-like domain-containing protein [Bacteroidales bacterium]